MFDWPWSRPVAVLRDSLSCRSSNCNPPDVVNDIVPDDDGVNTSIAFRFQFTCRLSALPNVDTPGDVWSASKYKFGGANTLLFWLKMSAPAPPTILRSCLPLESAWYVAVAPPVNRLTVCSFDASAIVCSGFELRYVNAGSGNTPAASFVSGTKLGMYASAYVMPAPELSLFVMPLSVVVRVNALLSASVSLLPTRWSRFTRRF